MTAGKSLTSACVPLSASSLQGWKDWDTGRGAGGGGGGGLKQGAQMHLALGWPGHLGCADARCLLVDYQPADCLQQGMGTGAGLQQLACI